MRKITTLDALHALYDDPVPAALVKVAPELTPLYRRWIEGARFAILSTVGPDGVHGSPRGDDGPVVRVQDANSLLMPDWRGNNRLDCLRDIVLDGRAALLFLVPGTNTTVRVNGRAALTDDPSLRRSFAKGDRLPTTVIRFEIAQVYTQCAKALLRSGLWSCGDISQDLPTTGEILADMSNGEHGGKDYDRTYPAYAKPRMW
ncbi:pyridoxamine 5'-phosphate oxidase family protein [Mameliella alba]|nr:pyridoxamine 5'-phosphate oxidase family protein [Antarctobacter heliothermus]MBY6145117.1 pyridoxamine 5'-phosphate oxidase family protein [Mameliella alba]MBY6160634.1 pyridoxamine 5'-phosphate oxidase family protein [Mameliella alba]MBY6169104.1 pyridoxamine 5'-phosphate oxidase family protein [Mameliella alba]MBY6173675.1 pyridoxamine 5'-phosphate oxidase family protein [Mameliella alba]